MEYEYGTPTMIKVNGAPSLHKPAPPNRVRSFIRTTKNRKQGARQTVNNVFRKELEMEKEMC